jgi:hypothetical protein
MSPDAYQSLLIIHQATQQIVEQIKFLTGSGLLLPHFAEVHRLTAEQNCAEISHSAILDLAGREHQDAARFEKERLQAERALQSS